MPWCHNCHVEYAEGTEACADCGAALLSEPPSEQNTATGAWAAREMSYLCGAASSIEADNIMACLRAEDIPVVRRHGGNLKKNIVVGYVNQPTELFVPLERLEEAKKLLEELEIALNDDSFVPGPDEEAPTEGLGVAWSRRFRLIFVVCAVVICLLLFLNGRLNF